MRKRTGDWRDLLSAYSLAIDTKKLFLGFIATLLTVIVLYVAAIVYAWLAGTPLLTVSSGTLAETLVAKGRLLDPDGAGGLLFDFMKGEGLKGASAYLPLLNPFYSGQPVHFILSILFYAALLWVWSGSGGVISRLAALEYARGDLPTLAEAKAMVRSKRMSYFFAPLWPLIFIVVFSAMNALGGLVASAWWPGRVLLIPGFPLLILSTIVIVFLIVFSVLGFGMMMPAISVGGKDAFEGWSSSFSYILWGFGRLVCYMLITLVIGAVAAVIAWGLVELLIYGIYETVNVGYVRALPWVIYDVDGLTVKLLPTLWAEGSVACVVSIVLMPFLLALRALSVAYVFAYFFSANTVMFLLMRKHVDNVEIDEIYEEEEEEGELEMGGEAEGEAAAEDEEAEEDEGEAEEEGEEEEAAEEEPDEAVEEGEAKAPKETKAADRKPARKKSGTAKRKSSGSRSRRKSPRKKPEGE